jgi:uncharacterized protein (DUF697 family)
MKRKNWTIYLIGGVIGAILWYFSSEGFFWWLGIVALWFFNDKLGAMRAENETLKGELLEAQQQQEKRMRELYRSFRRG